MSMRPPGSNSLLQEGLRHAMLYLRRQLHALQKWIKYLSIANEIYNIKICVRELGIRINEQYKKYLRKPLYNYLISSFSELFLQSVTHTLFYNYH